MLEALNDTHEFDADNMWGTADIGNRGSVLATCSCRCGTGSSSRAPEESGNVRLQAEEHDHLQGQLPQRLTGVTRKIQIGEPDPGRGGRGGVLPDAMIDYYVADFASSAEALRSSFGVYQGLDTTIAQDQQRASWRLATPVLADVGHFVAEEAPDWCWSC